MYGAKPFSPNFEVFAIFDRNFANIVAPYGDESAQGLIILK